MGQLAKKFWHNKRKTQDLNGQKILPESDCDLCLTSYTQELNGTTQEYPTLLSQEGCRQVGWRGRVMPLISVGSGAPW